MAVLLAVVATLLAVSVTINVIFYITRHRFENHWLSRETRALDRARAAELRAAEQIDAMLDRVATTPRLELDASRKVPAPDPDTRHYFADDDDPVEERAWNDYRGEPDEDSEAEE